MDAGQAITAALREQRRRDLVRLRCSVLGDAYYALGAWLMWGWHINGPGGLGVPGATYPWSLATEPRWLRRDRRRRPVVLISSRRVG